MKKLAFYLIVFSVSSLNLFAGMVDTFLDNCEKGDMQGCYQAGVVYWQGEGAEKDIEAGKELLQIACDGGFDDACVAIKTLLSEEKSANIAPQNSSAVVAANNQYIQHFDGKLLGDIDRDGKEETIAWKKFASTDLGDFYQLLAIDDDGTLLWEGPKEKAEANPYVFSSLDTGVSMPELLIDFDHDGNIEMLAPEPQSDVRPTYFRKLRWRETYFEPLLSNALMRQSPGSDRFIWKTTQASYGTWISKLAPYGKGMIKADVTEYNKDQSAKTGVALIRFDREGASVEQWLEPLVSANSGNEVTAQEVVSHTPTPAQTKYTYRARLSHRDHQNSGGKRLTKAQDILRQDRANYYKQSGDTEDQKDSYFYTSEERASMEYMNIYPIGASGNILQNKIINGTPLVEVEVRPNGLYIKILEE